MHFSIFHSDLANKDVLSKSDPMCVVFQRPFNSKKWVEVLRTEVLDNNLNPDFATKVCVVADRERFSGFQVNNALNMCSIPVSFVITVSNGVQIRTDANASL